MEEKQLEEQLKNIPKDVISDITETLFDEMMRDTFGSKRSYDVYGNELCQQPNDNFSEYRYFCGDIEYDYY